jgi:hypothetical protein
LEFGFEFEKIELAAGQGLPLSIAARKRQSRLSGVADNPPLARIIYNFAVSFFLPKKLLAQLATCSSH